MGKAVLLELQDQAHAQSTMKLCIVSLQAILLAVILVQYHYFNEVEAEKTHRFSNENWFSSVEKRIELIQDRMTEVYQLFKEKAQKILADSRSFVHEAIGISTINKGTVNSFNFRRINERVKIYDLFKKKLERRDLLNAYTGNNDAGEKRHDAPDPQVVMEIPEDQKRKRKTTKKHKKKLRVKHHEPHEHIPHEQRVDVSVEPDKVSYAKSSKRVLRKSHKRREKEQERINQRKFVKTLQRESNSSESDEVKKRKPVDIIVHIKMNE